MFWYWVLNVVRFVKGGPTLINSCGLRTVFDTSLEGMDE